MTKEDKELLLIDLCSRLPYNTKIQLTRYSDLTGEKLPSKIKYLDYCLLGRLQAFCKDYTKDEIRPYLFPLSSMTEEQKKELLELGRSLQFWDLLNEISDLDCVELIDWLIKNHFDYRGLIQKGLAIDATGKGIY